jgi:hypothetical protein
MGPAGDPARPDERFSRLVKVSRIEPAQDLAERGAIWCTWPRQP